MTDDLIASEREKYERIFKFHNYGMAGHAKAGLNYALPRMKPGSTMADFGCGRGMSIPPFAEHGMKCVPVDHVPVLARDIARRPNVLSFVQANLWADTLPRVDYGICTDVMEHIPEEVVDATLLNISKSVAVACLWSICHVKDVFGDKIGDRLHMTIQPHGWWMAKLAKYWEVVDVIRTSAGTSFYWTEHLPSRDAPAA